MGVGERELVREGGEDIIGEASMLVWGELVV